MNFVIRGRDATDEGALERRMAARPAHVEMTNEMRSSGHHLLGVATLDEKGNMNGSVIIANYESREELNAWLDVEPYVTGKVWDSVEIIPCEIGPSFVNEI